MADCFITRGGGKSGGVQADLLWTNASFTSAFAAQKISIDLTDYKFVVMGFAMYRTHGVQNEESFSLKGLKGRVIGNNNTYIVTRQWTSDDSGVTFTQSWTEETRAVSNDWMIPLYIYGVK